MKEELLPLTRRLGEDRERLRSTERKIGVTRSATRAAWKTGALSGSWVNRAGHEEFGFSMDNDRFVHLKGVVQSGTNATSIFTLPVAVRPATPRALLAAASGGVALVTVGADGTVVAESLSGANVTTWVSLSGLMYSLDQYSDGDQVAGHGTKVSDGALSDPVAKTRKHLSGMIVMSGISETTSAPTSLEELFNLAHDHASPWRYPIPAVADDELLRMDITKNSMRWVTGSDASDYLSTEGLCWPSVGMMADRATATLASGVTEYGGIYVPQASVFKDAMGLCWVGCIVNVTNVAAGDDVLTLPAGFRPSQTAVIPVLNNNNPEAVKIKPDGVVEFDEAAATGWVSIAHAFWADN